MVASSVWMPSPQATERAARSSPSVMSLAAEHLVRLGQDEEFFLVAKDVLEGGHGGVERQILGDVLLEFLEQSRRVAGIQRLQVRAHVLLALRAGRSIRAGDEREDLEDTGKQPILLRAGGAGGAGLAAEEGRHGRAVRRCLRNAARRDPAARDGRRQLDLVFEAYCTT